MQDFDAAANKNIFSVFQKPMQSKSFEQTNIQSKPDIFEMNKKISNKNTLLVGAIGSSIISAGLLGLFLAKGVHGSHITKYAKKLSNDIKSAGSNSFIMHNVKKCADNILSTLEAASNLTVLKDVICDKILCSNKITIKFADNSRQVFKDVINNTIGKKYDKVGNKINDMTSLLQEYSIKNLNNLDKSQLEQPITIKNQTKTLKEWVEQLEENSILLTDCYSQGFSLGARKGRSDKRNSLLSGIREKISDKLFGNNKDYKKYVIEEVTKDAQLQLKQDIIAARKKVTNDIPLISSDMKNTLSDYSYLIKNNDKNNIDFIKYMQEQIEAFKSCSGNFETIEREKIKNEMINKIDENILNIKKGNTYTEKEKQELIEYVSIIKDTLINANSKGALEEVMTILKGLNSAELQNGEKIISNSDFKQFKEISSSISNGLMKATEKETDKYFTKYSEIEAGSAATDVFSVLLPAGAAALELKNCKDNDERVSFSLKTCIPLVGTFGTFVYGTVKMYSNAKNIIFSIVSGFVLNKSGMYLDDLYKDYKKSGSMVNVAKNESKNVMKDLAVEKRT